jgi:hypothetical protein
MQCNLKMSSIRVGLRERSERKEELRGTSAKSQDVTKGRSHFFTEVHVEVGELRTLAFRKTYRWE